MSADNAPKRLLATQHGIVEAPVDSVAATLFDVRPGGRSPLLPDGQVNTVDSDDGHLTVRVKESAGGQLTISVNYPDTVIALQGGYWYRSETALAPEESYCLVTQQIFNVATRLRWGVPLVARKPLVTARQHSPLFCTTSAPSLTARPIRCQATEHPTREHAVTGRGQWAQASPALSVRPPNE